MNPEKNTSIPLRYNKDKDSVFHIDSLECSYISDHVVLKAKDIQIPRSHVTILLGPSGAGKSTLLESLGLMSKTINPETTRITFFPEPGQKGYPFEQLWDDKNKAFLSKIRQDYFSFIFQSTNLMSNFSAIENVTLTGLIQSQESENANYNAINTMVEGLGILSLEYDKLPSAFSGGERQRIAFSRAAIPDFSVLFGDEPTGNLDHFNSNKLMEFIHDFISKHENKSALIVSHNIDLALDFADRIIIITKNFEDSSSSSTILKEFILDKDVVDWKSDPELKKRIKKEIELLLNNETSHFIKLLSILKKHDCPVDSYLSVKEKIIDWAIFNDQKVPTDADIEKYRNLITQLAFKAVNVSPEEEKEILELIKQFFDPKKFSGKKVINRIISEIPEKKGFRARVKSLFDSGGKKEFPAEKKQVLLKKGVRPILFIFWVILSIVPWLNFLVEKIIDLIKSAFSSVFGKSENKSNGERNSILKKFNKWVTRRFYRTCLNIDSLFSEFELNKNKKTTIKFEHSDHVRLIDSLEIHPREILDTPRPFKKLFYKRESEKLLGNNNKNLWLIMLILFLTFLAIGFSSGSLEYLEMKMNDPFIRSVSADIPSTSLIYRKATRLIDEINQNDSLKQEYKIDTIIYYNTRTFHVKGDLPNSSKYGLDGRTVSLNDPLFSIIVDKKINESEGHAFLNDQDYSIILTREALKKLNCSESPSFVFKEVQYQDSMTYLIPIPIAAIVKSLPGTKTDYVVTPYFYQHLNNLGDKFLFDPDNVRLFALIVMDSIYVKDFEQVLDNFFKQKPKGIVVNDNPSIERLPYSYKNMYKMTVAFENYNELTIKDLRALFDMLKHDKSVVEFMTKAGIQDQDFVQSYSPNFSSERKWPVYCASFNFSDLAKVEAFSIYIKENADIKLEMSNIERMKNYNFVTKLTSLISVLLIFFSVLMITLFLANILRTHLNSIKMNIGTFKAFGIDIGHIYQRMMFMYIVLPLIASVAFCAIVGYSGSLYYFIQFLSKYDIENNRYFNLFNYWTLGSIVVLLTVNYFTFSKIIKDIFNQTPGDLIYDRSNKA